MTAKTGGQERAAAASTGWAISSLPWVKQLEPRLRPFCIRLRKTFEPFKAWLDPKISYVRTSRVGKLLAARAAWLGPKLSYGRNRARQFLFGNVRASEAVSRKHVQPAPWLELSILLGAFLLTAVIYGLYVSRLYSHLEEAIKNANVIRTVLSEAELRPLNPTQNPQRGVAGFKNNAPLDRRDIFEYLHATGVIDANVNYDQLSDAQNAPAATNIALATAHKLIGHIDKCAGQQGTLEEIKTVRLLACVAMERGYGTVPTCGAQASPDQCHPEAWFENGIIASLAQIPTKEDALAAAVADNARVCKPASGAPQLCMELRQAVERSPSLWTYAFTYSSSPPSINDLVRAVLIGTGVIPRVGSSEPAASPPPAGATALNSAVEKLLRVSFARIATAPQVKSASSWLAGIRGWEQFWMLFVLLAILFFLLARWIARRTLATEIMQTTVWFRGRVEKIYRKHAVVDEELNGGDNEAPEKGSASKAESGRDRGKRQPLLRSIMGRPRSAARESAQDEFRALDNEIDRMIDSKEKLVTIDGAKIRSDSLALFMLSKAVKRMLVADPEPELFRSYCQDQRELVEDSAWFLRYLARALPALGFIGTVHGIMLALGDADVIVRAGNPDQMAAAMSSLTTPLSLAFATTFIALLFGLITSYATDLELSKERTLFATLESELIECVDPAERYSTPPSGTSP